MSDVNSLLKRFLRFEKEQKLFDQSVFKKFYYWNIVRQYLYECLLEHYGLYSYEPTISGEKWDRRKKVSFFKELLKNEINLLKQKKKNILLICTSRNLNEKGYATDSLMDDYLNILNSEEYYQVELFNNLPFNPKTKYSNRYFSHLLVFAEKFSFLLVPFFSKKIAALLQEFKLEFGQNVKVDEKFTKKMIAEFIIQYYFYKRILKKIGPKVVIASQWATGLYRACNEMGIDCVELQHGSFSGNYTLMYDYPKDLTHIPISSFPKYFFTFGEYWKHITNIPGKKIVLGNSYLSIDSPSSTVNKKFRSIVFVSNKDFTPIFLPILKASAKHFPDIKFYFKLHSPEYEYKDLVKEELKPYSNIVVVYNEKTTNELLNISDVMFTIHSTVLYQALQIGIKAIILKKKYYWISEDALNLKGVFLVNDTEELLMAIESIYKTDDFERSSKKQFFEPFHGEVFRQFLKQYS